ncbi:hypothetical protein SNEBB_008475 [Seison nebaliae]|nr:hypothetical protein SNEBB_008475 [Seison nebaliae]
MISISLIYSSLDRSLKKLKLNQQISNYSSLRRLREKKVKRMTTVDPLPSMCCLKNTDNEPKYLESRLKLWNELKVKREEFVKNQERKEIEITLPNGDKKKCIAWQTTPFAFALENFGGGRARNFIVAKVDNDLWDLERPLEKNCKLELLSFNDKDGKYVYWHSSAHILGEAMEWCYGGDLCYGPPIQDGFYYDMFIKDRSVQTSDMQFLEQQMKKIIKQKQPFERLEMTKNDLLQMFSYNQFKCRILNEKVKTDTTTVYRCGDLIDLCMGPHVRHTGSIKAVALTKNSSSYWEGKSEAEVLQRIYGISFPENAQLAEWKKIQAEAAARNHRKIGKDQELFFFHELSPGSCFFYPKGAYIYNTLISMIRKIYRKNGFKEVVSPNMYNVQLWQTSGHWAYYEKNMFSFEVEKEKFALKPMNCPGHCLMFASRPRSWKELPLRYADFGVLHRNELSGALSGLTRVRRFQQDDAHIFCRQQDIKNEIKSCLQFLTEVYGIFDWEIAEKQLGEALDEYEADWEIDEAGGAFYGPKIDITVTDAMRREHQCATIQLDFQLPNQFNLQYTTGDTEKQYERPVIIHRAVLGSVERMIAILTENYGGKWPFWLSPRQIKIIPVAPPVNDYAIELNNRLYEEGFECDYDIDNTVTFKKKIRNAQLAQYNFIAVVGEQEMKNRSINVRTRDNNVHGEVMIEDAIKRFKELKTTYEKDAELKFKEKKIEEKEKKIEEGKKE